MINLQINFRLLQYVREEDCLDQIIDYRFGYDLSILDNGLKNNFKVNLNQDYGKCFRFNSGKNLSNHSIPTKNSTIGGRNDFLKVSFNTTKTIGLGS
jgi:hypothetical protein